MSQPALQLVPKEPAHEEKPAQALTPEQKAAQAAELQSATEAMHRANDARARVQAQQTEYTRKGQEAVSQLSLVTDDNGSRSNSAPKIGTDHAFIKSIFFIEVAKEDPKTVVLLRAGTSGGKKSVLNLKGSFTTTCASPEEAQELASDLKAYHGQQRNYGVYIPSKP